MNFIDYIKDKRFFISFYILIMFFISLIMLVSVNQEHMLNTIIYINVSCFLFACLYIIIGYYYKKKFYIEFSGQIESGQNDFTNLINETKRYEQKQYLYLFNKILKEYHNQLQNLFDEKRDQQEFIMSWIHEVKLPIAASRLLIENSEGKTVDMLVDKFEDELDKIDSYVEQALYFSRVDSFSKDYFISEVHVNKIVKSSVKKYAKLFINKEIQFVMMEGGQLIQSDSKWLGFVIDQILSNSLKYTNTGGKITVSFGEDAKEKRLIIQDNGIGIKFEDIHRVFEKGFTGSIGRSYAASTGMGLYLAKQLANKLGHDITITSEEDRFTKVTLHFPKIRNYYQLENE